MAEDRSKIIPVNIEDEMKSAYIDYSMSVIVSRALPDVRDGLKPVHRRVMFGMDQLGLAYNKSYKKSARIVGEVLGKYHPHGDSSVYDTMVRMAQDWSLRYTLVDGQGNFGSVDGDSPAAMRYTEVRFSRMAHELLRDINKETVDFALNFDDTLTEPTVLPTRIPNLLVNGSSGIAVGMATNMLPHNLTEVIAGIKAQIANPDISIDELMEHIKAPDFPTGGMIYGVEGIKEAYHTGRGRVVVRGKATIEEVDGRERIIITEIPYQVNKANLIVKISDLVKEEKITGISGINDESDRSGMRIVVDIKRDSMAQVVLSKLYKYSALQTSYGINNVALVKGRPRTLNLKELISEFIEFRIEVVVRRAQYDLRKAEERSHILEGLIIAVDNIDEVIKIIRSSATVEQARERLMASFALSELQARAILDMRLSKLTGLEIDKLKEEYEELQKLIGELKELLSSVELQRGVVVTELEEVNAEFGDARMTEITYSDGEVSIEDMIPNTQVVVTISHLGYMKRTNLDEYKNQGRGGKGSKGARTRDQDFVEHLFVANNHNYLLLFTEAGRCFWLRIYEIPEATKSSMGRVLQNLLQIPKEDKVKAYIVVEDLEDQEFLDNNFVMFCTKKGIVKKTSMEAYSRPRTNGINAITIQEGDQLIEAKLTNGSMQIMIGNKMGKAVKFEETNVRPMGRNAAGVKGMTLNGDKDEVVGMITIEPDDIDYSVLVVSENGYGKRSPHADYRLVTRGGKGVYTLDVTEKTGRVFALKSVSDEDDLMITSKSGIVIRLSVNSIRIAGRQTQGVRLISLMSGDSIADVAVVPREEESSSEEE